MFFYVVTETRVRMTRKFLMDAQVFYLSGVFTVQRKYNKTHQSTARKRKGETL